MATEKVTPMVLKVDLQCQCCYKKIKKTLCKFPQVRDQVFDEKNNTVNIIVVCCSPEKIRDKLFCKAGKVIKSIEIKDASKPKPADKPKEGADKPKPADKSKEGGDKPKQADKPKEGGGDKPKVVVIEKPKEPKVTFVDKPPEKPKDATPPAEKPKSNGKADKPKSDGPPPAAEKPKEAPKMQPAQLPEPAAKPLPAGPAKGPEPVPVHGVPSVFPYLGPSYDGYSAGPYYHGYGFPPPPQPCYEGYYGGYGPGPAYGPGSGYGPGYGYGGRPGYTNRCDGYFSEENPQGCFIM